MDKILLVLTDRHIYLYLNYIFGQILLVILQLFVLLIL